jgi:hypothetical protein
MLAIHQPARACSPLRASCSQRVPAETVLLLPATCNLIVDGSALAAAPGSAIPSPANPALLCLLRPLCSLTDSKGRTVDFKNTLIILTSNVGSSVIEKGGGGIGFQLVSLAAAAAAALAAAAAAAAAAPAAAAAWPWLEFCAA